MHLIMHLHANTYAHTPLTFTFSHTPSYLPLSHTQAPLQANKRTDEPWQAQNPFITSHYGEDAEVDRWVLPSLSI